MGVHSMQLILLVFAFVLTLIAAFWRGGPWPSGFPLPHPGWLGLSLYILTFIIR